MISSGYKFINEKSNQELQNVRPSLVTNNQDKIHDKDKSTTEKDFQKFTLKEIKFEKIPKKAMCMISKTFFEEKDEIAQCSNC